MKPPKNKAGRRTISLPAIVVAAQREHRREQLELRMALGIGKMPDDALVFPAPLKGGIRARGLSARNGPGSRRPSPSTASRSTRSGTPTPCS